MDLRNEISTVLDENRIIKKHVIKEFINKLSDEPYRISHDLLLSLWRRAETSVKDSTVQCSKQGCQFTVCSLYDKSGLCSKHKIRTKKQDTVSRSTNKPKCIFMIKRGKTKQVECKMSALIGKYCKRHARVMLESGVKIDTRPVKTIPDEDIKKDPENTNVLHVTIEEPEHHTDNIQIEHHTDNIQIEHEIKPESSNDSVEDYDQKESNEKECEDESDDIVKFIEEKKDTLSQLPKPIRCSFQKLQDGVMKRCKKDGFAIFGGLCEHHRNKRRSTHST